MNESKRDLEMLLGKLLDDSLNNSEREQLSKLVSESETARRDYLETIATHAALREEFGGPLVPSAEKPTVGGLPLRNTATQVSRFFRRPTPFSITIAALVMGVLVTSMAFMVPPFYRAMVRNSENKLDPQRVVAELTGLHDAVWADEQSTAHEGTYLAAGRSLELTSGLAHITFDSGAEMIVTGPARFTVVAENAGQIDFGRLTARVPPPAVGFAVTSPTATVVDLGTEFQMGVDRAGTEQLFVFAGVVRVTGVEPTSTRIFQDVRAGQGLQWTGDQAARGYTPPAEERFATMAAKVRPDATVLYFDNFNTGDTDNFDGAPLAGRQGGLLADEVKLRSARVQQQIADNKLQMVCAVAGSGRIGFLRADQPGWYDWAAGSAATTILNADTLRIDFVWTAPDTTSNDWISFSIGHPGPSHGEPGMRVNDPETDYGILLRGNGGTQRFEKGVSLAASRFLPTTNRQHVVIEIKFDSFADGSEVDVAVKVAGQPVDQQTFTWNNNDGQLYMELGTLQTGMLIDNLRLVALGESEKDT